MEHVVLLDPEGTAIGSAAKSEIHHGDTPLHLAFSCYLLDARGRLLVTRRAMSKLTWPGVWTNSFCGHPLPGEWPEEAVHRRAMDELGAQIRSVRCVLPDFRYRATDDSGIVENELCPVFVARLDDESGLVPHPREVAATAWVDPAALATAVAAAPFAFSPWMRLQLPEVLDVLTGRAAPSLEALSPETFDVGGSPA